MAVYTLYTLWHIRIDGGYGNMCHNIICFAKRATTIWWHSHHRVLPKTKYTNTNKQTEKFSDSLTVFIFCHMPPFFAIIRWCCWKLNLSSIFFYFTFSLDTLLWTIMKNILFHIKIHVLDILFKGFLLFLFLINTCLFIQ